MHFQLDRRSEAAQTAERALVPAVVLTGVLYLLLDWGLARMLGGYWGGLLAIAVATTPLTALFRVALAGRTPRQAVKDGVACGIAVALLYAWVFTAPFVSLPGF
jgi:hypothetical protein